MSSPSRRRSKLLPLVALTAILLVAAALRLRHIDTESLWLDEAFSVALARGPMDALLAEVAEDVHPPFYFLLLSAWFQFTDGSGASARLLSTACSLGVVALGFVLGRRIGGTRTGLVAALLLTVSPFQIEYAQEARMYALVALLASGATLAFLSLGAPPRRSDETTRGPGPLVTGPWLAYVVSTTLLVNTHAAGWFVMGAHGVAARRRSETGARLLDRWTLAVVVVIAFFVPWMGTFLTQFSAVQTGFWVPRPAWRDLVAPLTAFAGHPLLAVVLAAAAAWGVWPLARTERASEATSIAWTFGLWLVVPIFAPFAVSLVGASVFLPKYTIAASVPFAVLAAAGLASLPRPARVLVIVATVVLAGVALHDYYSGMPRKDDWRRAVAEIERDAAPGDTVLVYPFFLEFPPRVYATRDDVRIVPFARHAAATTAPTLSAMLDEMTRGATRVWLVVMEYDARRGLLADRLHQRFDQVSARRYGHVDVFRFSQAAR